MRALKIALFLPLAGLVSLSAQAEPADPATPPAAHAKKKPHRKVVHRSYQPQTVAQVLPVAQPVATYAPHPYDWSGFYVGVYGGVSGSSNNPQFQIPSYGVPSNGIGFVPSNQYNSYGVLSGPYQALSNPPGPGAFTGLGTTAVSATGFSGAGGTYTLNLGGDNYNATPPAIAPNTINNLNGNTTNSQFSSNNQASRLMATIGGEVGYRKQFGIFVIGVDADGGFMDGKRTQSASSNGQFSNTQGYTGTVNSVVTYGSPASAPAQLYEYGAVNVENNGNSSFSQSVTAGPQWLGTARLTAGVALDRVLLYATGGLAYGQASIAGSANYSDTANSSCTGTYGNFTTGGQGAPNINAVGAGNALANYQCNGGTANTPSSFTYTDSGTWSGSYSKLKTGYAIGTGAAYAVTDNVILKLEGYYYNLGSVSTTLYGYGSQTLTATNAPSAGTPGTRAISVTPINVARKIDGFVAKVGLAIKFDTGTPEPVYPVVAKY